LAAEWDGRYAEHARMWSGDPNGAFELEVAGLPPGRALDVGCGEGADAIWLASRGWSVTAVDVSAVAIERARTAARSAEGEVDWVVGDAGTAGLARGGYDLVSVQYPAIGRDTGRSTVDAILGAVADGGVLLVVGHVIDPQLAAEHG